MEAIEEASWVVEGGDAHDLQDACDMAHASMADALAYTQQLESNDSQVKKALSDNGFASLEAFLQSYNQVKKERDAAIEELSGVLGKVENAADFIDEEIYCDLDYGTYRNLRDVVDDIAIWQNEDKWRGVCESNGGKDGKETQSDR